MGAHRTPMQGREVRARLWQSMRTLRQFTHADLMATAEAERSSTQKYVRGLCHAGYVCPVPGRLQGQPGSRIAYRLVRDTGPYAPRVAKSGTVTDPNLEPASRSPADRPVQVPKRDYERALCCVRACAGMQDPEAEVAELKRRAGGDA